MKTTPNKNEQSGSSNYGKESNPTTSNDLRSLFTNVLKDIYWVEKTLTKEIPRMIKKSTSEELVNLLKAQLGQTEEHARILEDVFTEIRIKNEVKTCEAMKGLIKEAEELMEETTTGVVCDAGIITSAQKIAHYEIASYGSLCAFAKVMGEERVASLLQQNLAEEKNIDLHLTRIAVNSINTKAFRNDSNK